ncbi:MAG: hypothetical protein IT336_02235 [Thermomicrobiales bacterium]|nr:hypothetical protein [Thermomicrobiales bacterium]
MHRLTARQPRRSSTTTSLARSRPVSSALDLDAWYERLRSANATPRHPIGRLRTLSAIERTGGQTRDAA